MEVFNLKNFCPLGKPSKKKLIKSVDLIQKCEKIGKIPPLNPHFLKSVDWARTPPLWIKSTLFINFLFEGFPYIRDFFEGIPKRTSTSFEF